MNFKLIIYKEIEGLVEHSCLLSVPKAVNNTDSISCLPFLAFVYWR